MDCEACLDFHWKIGSAWKCTTEISRSSLLCMMRTHIKNIHTSEKSVSFHHVYLYTAMLWWLLHHFSLQEVACVITGKAQLQTACNRIQTSKQNKTPFSKRRNSWKPLNGDPKEELLQLYNLPLKLLSFRRASPQELLSVDQPIGK